LANGNLVVSADSGATVVASDRATRGRLKWVVALLAIGFAGLMIHRGIQIISLRTFALDASEAYEEGHWQRLELVTRRWQEKDPQAAMAWLLAAEAANQQGSPGRMASYLERMPPSDPQTPAALLDLATAYFGPLNQPTKGEAACLRSLELASDNVEARRRLVFYYSMTLQRQKLIRAAREAIAAGNDAPETYVYLIGADWLTLSNAADYNGKWLQSGDDPENFLVAYLIHWAGSTGLDSTTDDHVSEEEEVSMEPGLRKRIDALLGGSNRSEWGDHRQKIASCLKEYPNNSELIAYQLKIASADGDVDKVSEWLSRVPDTASGDNRFFHYKGWLHDALGESELAIEAYRTALRLNPFDWRSQMKLGAALRLVGDDDEADRLATLGIAGKELRETILQLKDVQSIPMAVLEKMRDYCRRCGDEMVAAGLDGRIEQIRRVQAQKLASGG
jgi:tetratricopeptide (TPR) repeat protein